MIGLGIGAVVLLAILGFLVLLVGWGIVTYNSLVNLRNQLQNAWAQIDVQLKRRYDLIPNLVEVVKDYMQYEQEVLDILVGMDQLKKSLAKYLDEYNWFEAVGREQLTARRDRSRAAPG